MAGISGTALGGRKQYDLAEFTAANFSYEFNTQFSGVKKKTPFSPCSPSQAESIVTNL
jgi:hypothetical protein